MNHNNTFKRVNVGISVYFFFSSGYIRYQIYLTYRISNNQWRTALTTPNPLRH